MVVPGLIVQILINRLDMVGQQVACGIKLVNPDQSPMDRITAKLRRRLHDDLDRVLNDTNKLWDESFRPQAYPPDGLSKLIEAAAFEAAEKVLKEHSSTKS